MKFIMLLSLLLLLTSIPSHAGRIYRFADHNGVSTLSKILPPYAAQKGYDILDDKSLRLIERIYTREELIQIQEKQAILDLKNEAIQQRKNEQRQRLLKQRINDRNLLARYPSVSVFIKSRDDDLSYRQAQINDISEQLKSNKRKLTNLQMQAAEQEIGGESVSENLNLRLVATQKEIEHNKLYISRSAKDNQQVTEQYIADLERLELLLGVEESDIKQSEN